MKNYKKQSQVLDELNNEVIRLYSMGLYYDAEKKARSTLITAVEIFGHNHPYVNVCSKNLESISIKSKETNSFNLSTIKETYSNSQKKKMPILPVGLLLLIVILVLILYTETTRTTETKENIEDDTISATPTTTDRRYLPYYIVKADFYPDEKLVIGEQEITFLIDKPVSELAFDLYMNRFLDTNLDKSEIRSYAKKSEERGFIKIKWVSYQGTQIPFQEKDNLLKVYLNEGNFEPGKHNIEIAFKIKIPIFADRVGGNEKGVWLGNWLPTLSFSTRTYPSTEIGDPFVNLTSSYEVYFSIPKDYTLVLSNTELVSEQGNIKNYYGKIDRVRDLPIFLHKGYNKVSILNGQTMINFYYYSNSNKQIDVLDNATYGLSYFNNMIEEYPWQELNIVEADMYLSGMEYSTMILLSPSSVSYKLEKVIFHEIAHQWFYNIIGSHQYESAFLDEGLVDFLTNYEVNHSEPKYWSHLSDLTKGLDQFDTWQSYRTVHYISGRRLFENLYIVLGKKDFFVFIEEYYNRFKYDLVTLDDFKQFLVERLEEKGAEKMLNSISN